MKTQLFCISPSLFSKLIREHISLDAAYLLECAYNKWDVKGFTEKKIQALLQGLQRNNYVDEQGLITHAGILLYESLLGDNAEEVVLGKVSDRREDFEAFWKAYPATDSVIVEGKMLFKGTRSLRKEKEACRLKFLKILSEGDYSPQDLIRAVQYETQLKIERSLKTRENKLSYQAACLVWLNQRVYESFVEESRLVELKPLKKPTSWEI